MKSIKEKADEYVLGFHSSIQRMCKESYIDGANYVLEEIEKLTSNQNWYAFPKQSHKELKELIKQLKK